MAEADQRNPTRAMLALLGLAVVGLALHVAWVSGFARGELDELINHWIYNGVLMLAAAVCVLRAVASPEQRSIWLAVGFGVGLWAGADIYWSATLAGVKNAPYPRSPTSAICWSILSYGGCRALGATADQAHGQRLARRCDRRSCLGLSERPCSHRRLLASADSEPLDVATSLSYLLGDMLLLSFLIVGIGATGLRPGRTWLLIGAGIAVWGVADGIYLYQQALGTYGGGYLDCLWLAAGILIAGAAVLSQGATPRGTRGLALDSGPGPLRLCRDRRPCLGSLRALDGALDLALGRHPRGRDVAPRAHVPLERGAADGRSQRGRHRCAHRARQPSRPAHRPRSAVRGPGQTVLAIFDLDGFKAYNDGFGHPAGDALLQRIGDKLARGDDRRRAGLQARGRRILRPRARWARNALAPLLAEADEVLHERGEGFLVSASAGAAVVPAEANRVSTALHLADTRMYHAKGRSQVSVQRQAHDVLTRPAARARAGAQRAPDGCHPPRGRGRSQSSASGLSNWTCSRERPSFTTSARSRFPTRSCTRGVRWTKATGS